MATYMEIRVVPKDGQAKKEVTIKLRPVTMTVQEFCDFFNGIDKVIGFWHKDNHTPEDKKLYETIEKFLEGIEFSQGLPAEFPDLFDCTTTKVNLTKEQFDKIKGART